MIVWGCDNLSFIYSEAERLAKLHGTRNPYELLDAIGAKLVFSDQYKLNGLKGFAAIINRQKFVIVNAKLDEVERMIVAGHEAGHLILHEDIIASSPAFAIKDFNVYDNTGRLELEANTFIANFLVTDNDVLESLAETDNFYITSKELFMPAQLLAIKMADMLRRGYAVRSPESIDSKFLGKSFR